MIAAHSREIVIYSLDNSGDGNNVRNNGPVQGQAAIVVMPIAVMRLADGSYIAEAKRRGYEFSDARDDAENYFEDSPEPVPQGFHVEPPDDQLPPGFTQ